MPVLLCFSKETIFGTIFVIAVTTWLNLRQLIVIIAYHQHKSNKQNRKIIGITALYISILLRVGVLSGFRNTWFNILVMVHMIFRDFYLALPTIIILILWVREANWGFYKILIISISTYCSIIGQIMIGCICCRPMSKLRFDPKFHVSPVFL